MIEARGNLWTYLGAAGFGGARVITTNGFVKANGECVMGRGCAREARDRWPWLAKMLGAIIREDGNHVYRFPMDWGSLVTFPAKPERGPNGEPGWQARAEPALIERSAAELVRIVDGFDLPWCVLPRPGCGNGGLAWEDVRPLLEPLLDDRFHVITFA